MKELVLILVICTVPLSVTYIILKIGSMTGYLGWLAIPMACFVYFVVEIAAKRWGMFRNKK
jgi:hypothetical protein